jgi:hypothetical protein
MKRTVIIGGGAAGFFAAIACAEAARRNGVPREVVVLERGSEFLTKVRISGGGRCNVTHACFEPRALAARYPRGGRALIGPFSRFQAADTVAWFESRGVKLKTEADGRMFPVSDDSATIIDCLMREARAAGVMLRTRCAVERVEVLDEGGFLLHLAEGGDGSELRCDRLLLATGGCKGPAAGNLAALLGHTVEPPVPSLFTFNIEVPWLRELSGLSVEPVEVSVPGTRLRERGPLLATHWGASGPAILRLSAWGARELHALDYRFPLEIHWLPGQSREAIAQTLAERRTSEAGGLVVRSPLRPLPLRLWERLALAAGVTPEMRWAALPKATLLTLAALLSKTTLPVTGKSTNKAEFVTCGGVRLAEVDFKTMESRRVPGLHFAGEVLDFDGVTGGFNFQAAWTTGWLAGLAMAP